MGEGAPARGRHPVLLVEALAVVAVRAGLRHVSWIDTGRRARDRLHPVLAVAVDARGGVDVPGVEHLAVDPAVVPGQDAGVTAPARFDHTRAVHRARAVGDRLDLVRARPLLTMAIGADGRYAQPLLQESPAEHIMESTMAERNVGRRKEEVGERSSVEMEATASGLKHLGLQNIYTEAGVEEELPEQPATEETIPEKPVGELPRGWHLRKEFVDEDGNVFSKGQFIRNLNDEE